MGALLMYVLPPLLFPLVSAHVDMQMTPTPAVRLCVLGHTQLEYMR